MANTFFVAYLYDEEINRNDFPRNFLSKLFMLAFAFVSFFLCVLQSLTWHFNGHSVPFAQCSNEPHCQAGIRIGSIRLAAQNF
jgi:hypothetical protein